MAEHRTLVWASVCALLLPFLFATMSESDAYVMSNWITMAGPQLAVIGLAVVFPSLRTRFATVALVSLSIVLLAFRWIISLDANGGMLWMYYFPATAVVVFVAWLISKRKGNTRGL